MVTPLPFHSARSPSRATTCRSAAHTPRRCAGNVEPAEPGCTPRTCGGWWWMGWGAGQGRWAAGQMPRRAGFWTAAGDGCRRRCRQRRRRRHLVEDGQPGQRRCARLGEGARHPTAQQQLGLLECGVAGAGLGLLLLARSRQRLLVRCQGPRDVCFHFALAADDHFSVFPLMGPHVRRQLGAAHSCLKTGVWCQRWCSQFRGGPRPCQVGSCGPHHGHPHAVPPKPNSRPAALATPCAALRFFCITFYTHTHHPSPPVPRNAVITNRAALPRSVLRFPPTFNAYLSIIDDAERPGAGLARVPCRRPSCCLVTGSGVQMGRLQWRNRRGVPIEALQS